jgi:archaellum component FlaC
MSDFYRSAAFKKFIENDMPKMAEALTSISKQLATINEREQRRFKLEEKLLLTQIKVETQKLNEQRQDQAGNA